MLLDTVMGLSVAANNLSSTHVSHAALNESEEPEPEGPVQAKGLFFYIVKHIIYLSLPFLAFRVSVSPPIAELSASRAANSALHRLLSLSTAHGILEGHEAKRRGVLRL